MQIGVPIEELELKFDYSKVTFVQGIILPDPADSSPVKKRIEAVEVHFVGGESITLPGWTFSKWLKWEEQLLRSLSLQIKPGMPGLAPMLVK